jgi:hypothetical protein
LTGRGILSPKWCGKRIDPVRSEWLRPTEAGVFDLVVRFSSTSSL